MAMTPFLYYTPWVMNYSTNNNMKLDASTEAMCIVGIAPKSGDIDRIVLTNYTAAVTGTSPTYDWRIETATSTADLIHASGSLWATNTNVTQVPANDTVHTLTLTSPATVSAGDYFAVAVRYSSGTIDASNNWTMHGIANHPLVPRGVRYMPQTSFYDGAAWVNSALYPLYPPITPLYDDDEPAWLGFHRVNHNTSDLGVDGDERATVVRFAVDVQASAFHIENRAINMGAGDYLTLRLYDSSGNVLESYQADYGELNGTNQGAMTFPFAGGPITLNAGEWYTIGHTPTGYAGGRMIFVQHGSDLAKFLSYGEYGVSQFFDVRAATRTYSASWTGWTESSSNTRGIGLVITGIETGNIILPRRGGLVTRL